MTLDTLDKKIINCLNENTKSQYSEIAKKCNSSKEVISYRIKNLQTKGIIKEFVTIFGFGYWSNKILISFSKIDNTREEEIINFLKSHSNINWITPCSGSWDMVFSIMAKNPKHFDELLRKILKEIGENISQYKMGTSVGSYTFGHTYILGKTTEPKKKETENKNRKITFDKKDKEIAKIIHTNARTKLINISIQTKIPVDTVKYRIKKMEENKIIKRYRMILDPSKLGYNRYEIFLQCINLTEQKIKQFYNFAKNSPNIEYLSKCVGSWNIEFTVHFKTNQELRNFVLNVKKEFGEIIQNFETITLFETYNFIYFPKELR